MRLHMQSGAPLVAEEAADEYSYLVGINSFGAKQWFVPFLFPVFIVLIELSIINFLARSISGMVDLPGESKM